MFVLVRPRVQQFEKIDPAQFAQQVVDGPDKRRGATLYHHHLLAFRQNTINRRNAFIIRLEARFKLFAAIKNRFELLVSSGDT